MDYETTGWFYDHAGERKGPATLDELKALVASGVVTRKTTVRRAGAAKGVPASYLAPLFSPLVTGADPLAKWMMPVGRSPLAIAAGYLGLCSVLPIFGYVGIVVALLAIRDLRRHREKSGWGRVIFCLAIAVPASVIYTYLYLTR